MNLNDIDILSSLIAAMCHDFKHSGFTNNYEINSKTQIALTYNGIYRFFKPIQTTTKINKIKI
jgi:hypothetical protein